MELSLAERLAMRAALRTEAKRKWRAEVGEGGKAEEEEGDFEIDIKQRTIFDHAHWHARSGPAAATARMWRKLGSKSSAAEEELWGPGGAKAADAATASEAKL